MKLLLASDIHGMAFAMRRLMARIEEEKPDRVILMGDLLNHMFLDEKDTPEMLNSIRVPVTCVKGNCDGISDQNQLNFSIMSEVITFEYEGRTVNVAHGDKLYASLDGLKSPRDLLLKGHTHVAEFEVEDRYTMINPGSVGLPRDGHASYAILEGGTVSWRSIDDGSEYMQKTLP